MKRIVGALSAVVIGASLVACGSDSSATATADVEGTCTADRVGGEITYGSPVGSISFDPNQTAAANASTGGFEMAAVFDTLMKYDARSGEFQPHVLDSIEGNDDSTQWTLRIHDGVTFGNGDPLDSAAFVANVERAKTGQIQGILMRETLQLLDSVEAVDPQTVVFNFSGPWAEFGDLLSSRPFMLVNTKIADERGDRFGSDPTGAGVGPYEFVSMKPGEEIVLKAKDNYWGGPVCIQTIRIIPTENSRLAADTLKTGEIDLTTIGDPVVASELADSGVKGIDFDEASIDVLVPNAAPGRPGSDLAFRRAMAAAIDTSVVNQRAFEGVLEPASGVLVYDDSPYYSDQLTGTPYDLEEAKRLVEQAKSEGWDGTTRLLGREGQDELVLVIQAMLEAAGMKVTTNIVPTTELVQRVGSQRDFDLVLWQLTGGTGNVWASLNRYTAGAPRNDWSWNDPQTDAALSALREASTDEARQDAMLTLQNRWNEEAPSTVIATRPAKVVYSDRLNAVSTSGFDYATVLDAFVQD